jgi:hypothetical protein
VTDRLTGTCLTVYPLGSLPDETKHAYAIAQPRYACAHGGPDAIIANVARFASDVKALAPSTKLIAGIGCDYWFGRAIAGAITTAQCVEEHMKAVRAAASAGVIAVVIDLEASGEGNAHVQAVASDCLIGIYAAIRSEFPTLIIGHTAYDVPVPVRWTDANGDQHWFGGQQDYIWSAACGAQGAEVLVPQVYITEGQDPPSTIGAAKWRLARHRDSWALAAAKWSFRADRQDAVYVQAHHSLPEAVVYLGNAGTFRMLWTARAGGGTEDTFDANGLLALRCLCRLDVLGVDLGTFQKNAGLTPDENCGPLTRAALGVT